MAIEEEPKNIFRLLNVLVSEKGLVRHLATANAFSERFATPVTEFHPSICL